MSVSGCLLSPPADYEEDQRIPPVLQILAEETEPTPYMFHEYSRYDTIEFRVPVRSNDGDGDGQQSALIAYLFRDFEYFSNGTENERGSDYIDAASFEDGPRLISIKYTFSDEPDGCYQYTLFVTHTDNGSPPEEVERQEDVAIVTWWINIESDDVPNDLRDCLTEGRQ
jgi:hypothetical protein